MHEQLTPIPTLSQEPGLSPPSRQRLLAAITTRRRAPLRILMVVESSAGGTGRHVLDLSEGLLARGCEVHLAYSTGRIDRFFADRITRLNGLRRIAVPMCTNINPGDWTAVRTIRRYMRTHGPFQIVHGHSSKGGAIARLAAPGTGANAFYTIHGLVMADPSLRTWKRLLYLGIELGLTRMTSRVIAVSPEEYRAAVRLGFGRSRVVCVPNGIAPLEFAAREDARRSIGATGDEVVIGFVGRLVDAKAPDVLLRAFARVLHQVPRSRLAIVGAGPLDGALRRLARDLNIDDRVAWLGEQDVRRVLAGFDVFALPSRREGLPYVALEAMAAGLPVVATSSSGVECLVGSGVNGLVVAPGDAGAFAASLAGLARDPRRRADFGRASRARAAHFTLDRMVDQTLAAYAAVTTPKTIR
jgi:glycosyltransferase involved in cell wall biosynthesis